MIDRWFDAMLLGDWSVAALRLLFVGLIYLFLVLVLRATVRDLTVAARETTGDAGRSRHAALIVLDAAGSSMRQGDACALQLATRIGRGAGNEIVVDDPHFSAEHAELRFERGQWWLRDLRSSNGTWLNDEPVRSVVAVHHGDVLQCGRVRFRFNTSIAVPYESAYA